jgi:hypothetical protein
MLTDGLKAVPANAVPAEDVTIGKPGAVRHVIPVNPLMHVQT